MFEWLIGVNDRKKWERGMMPASRQAKINLANEMAGEKRYEDAVRIFWRIPAEELSPKDQACYLCSLIQLEEPDYLRADYLALLLSQGENEKEVQQVLETILGLEDEMVKQFEAILALFIDQVTDLNLKFKSMKALAIIRNDRKLAHKALAAGLKEANLK